MGLGNYIGYNFFLGDIRLWEIIMISYIILLFIISSLQGVSSLGSWKQISYVLPFYLSALFSLINIKYYYSFISSFILLSLFIILFLIMANQKLYVLEKLPYLIIHMGILASIFGIYQITFGGRSNQMWYGIISRTTSFFDESNEFSQYLTVPFGYLLAVIFLSYKSEQQKGVAKYWIFLFIIICTQLLSFSRGGLLAFALQIFFTLFLLFRDKYILSIFQTIIKFSVIIIIIFITIINIEIVNSFTIEDGLKIMMYRITNTFNSGDDSLFDRFIAYDLSLRDMTSSLSYMILGKGKGSLVYTMGEYNQRFNGVATSSNYIIDIISETGILGLFSFIFIIYQIIFKGLKEINNTIEISSYNINILHIGSLLAIIGLLSGGVTSATHMQVFFWFTLGVISSINHNVNKKII